MTVTASPKDSDGAAKATAVAALATIATAAAGKPQAASISAALDQSQRELVYHYLNVGRLTAANILSTMT
jgi:hypothetical protein